MRKLIAAAAAIALAATMAQAEPGKGNKGGGKDRDPPAQAKGAGKPDRGPAMKENRAPNRMAQRDDRGPALKPDRGSDRGKGQANRPDQAERALERGRERGREVERGDDRGRDFDRRDARRIERGDDRGERIRDNRRIDRDVRFDFADNRGLIEGCPPGLAKKNNGCMPPGLAKKRGDGLGFREAFYRSDWWGYRTLGDRVFYDDGYLYRMGSDNSVLGYIPLLGGALSIGNPWPSRYQPVQLDDYYVDYYNLGARDAYRYADDVLYRVDPETTAITSIAALLTGDDFTIGQPMPLGYDVYNVPYAYRDRYYDTPSAMYRYSDGYVYQVDPETRLIAAAIELLI